MRKFFTQYKPYYKNYKLEIFYAFIGIILVALATAGTAYAIQPLLDDIFIKKDVNMLYIMPIIVVYYMLQKVLVDIFKLISSLLLVKILQEM